MFLPTLVLQRIVADRRQAVGRHYERRVYREMLHGGAAAVAAAADANAPSLRYLYSLLYNLFRLLWAVINNKKICGPLAHTISRPSCICVYLFVSHDLDTLTF